MRLDQFQRPPGVEPALQVDRDPAVQGRHQDGHGAGEAERQVQQEPVVLPEAQVDEPVEGRVVRVVVADHRALGPAGGARGVVDAHRVRPGPGHTGMSCLPGWQRVVDADHGQRGGERVHQGSGRLGVGVVGDEHAGAAVGEEGDELGRGGEGIERDEDRARPQRADEGLDVLGAVADQAGDPVAGPDAGPGQGVADPGRADIEVVPGPGRALEHDRGLVRLDPGPARDPLRCAHATGPSVS